MNNVQWEFCQHEADYSELVNYLNEKGAQGWEPVTIHQNDGSWTYDVFVVMKRQKMVAYIPPPVRQTCSSGVGVYDPSSMLMYQPESSCTSFEALKVEFTQLQKKLEDLKLQMLAKNQPPRQKHRE